jgi:hypothetical protein
MSVSRHGLVFLALLSVCLALVSQPDFAGDSIRIRDLEAKASTLNARDNVPAGFVAAPYYPAPPGGWVSSWSASYAKAKLVVASMTLAEKVNLTTGTGELMGPCVGNTGSAERFGIPNLCLQDSALGIAATDSKRRLDKASLGPMLTDGRQYSISSWNNYRSYIQQRSHVRKRLGTWCRSSR